MKSKYNQNKQSLNDDFAQEESILSIKESIVAGVVGFVIFFCMIVLAKTLVFILKINEGLIISTNDYIISFWGFIIFSFLIFVSKNRALFTSRRRI